MSAGLEPGATGERFEIRRKLGAGGMGVVYEAFDRERGQAVALKTLRSVDPRALYRFKQEFRALADLSHPNLIVLHELISVGDEWLFTMELLDGVDFVAWTCPGRKPPAGATSPPIATPSPGTYPTLVNDVEEPTAPTRPGSKPVLAARPASFDEARLRAALVQLATGVQALHDAGKLHRDLKPSNVLVTKEGRVVVCDFGLVADVGDQAIDQTQERGPTGTPRYMSPEQALRLPQGPPSDWYGVGAILYTALVGRAPHAGTLGDPIARQLADDPPAPRSLVESVPADLDALCMRLLSRKPEDRPSGREVLAALGAHPAPRPSDAPRAAAPAFVGRMAELVALRAAFADARRGRGVTVLVHGPSGIGKSSLVKAFLDGLAEEHPDALALTGRCWERESMPYKAVDAIVDALSTQLVRWPREEVEALLPPDVNLLARLFPVLRRVEAVNAPPTRGFAIPDPHEMRRRAFTALRALLGALAARRPLVLWIDDLQWGDADSAPLLAQLLRPPDPPALLLVASYREGDAGAGPLVAALRPAASIGAVDVRELEVGALHVEDARALARAWLGSADDDRALRVAREAGGNPFFVAELARHTGAAPGMASLDEVLAHRLARLPADAAAILEIVALAGRPLARGLVTQVSRLGTQRATEALARLRNEHLVRTAGVRDADTVEPYHDRIREHVARALSPEFARELHRRLALVLSGVEGADPEVLLEHWAAAGDDERAAEHAEQAAEQAARALAFDRAARLWQRTLEHRRPEGPEARRLLTRLADALAKAGRGADAARRYHEAVATGAGPAEALELRRRAAEQLMHSGHFEEGVAAAVEVLGAVDISLAGSAIGAIPRLLWKRMLLRLRGLGWKERDASEISPAELVRLDACWSVASGLSCIDTIRGADTQSKHLLLALRTGEPYRVARSLALESSYVATAGWPARQRSLRLTEKATAVAAKSGNPHALGVTAATAGVAAFLCGLWREAAEKCTSAEQLLRERCTGVHWELDSVQFFGLGARYYLGELGHLVRRVPQLLAEAEERGDLYAATGLASWRTNAAWLVLDDPEGARQGVETAMQRWTQRGFQLQHYYELLALTQIDLYGGDGEAAWRRVAAAWPALSRSLLRRVQNLRIEAACLRARATLAALQPGARDADGRLGLCEADARDIEKEHAAWAAPLATLIRAGVAARRGRTEAAIAALETAIAAFEQHGMALHATAARTRLAGLVGGTRGEELAKTTGAWFAGEGVRAPAGFVAMLAPGLEPPG